MELNPADVRVALILLLAAVCAFDLGIAFIIRTVAESGGESNDRD